MQCNIDNQTHQLVTGETLSLNMLCDWHLDAWQQNLDDLNPFVDINACLQMYCFTPIIYFIYY